MKRVLFVDDEPNILQGLRRMLRGMRKEWDMQFAGSAEEALEMFSEQPFDIVISDMRMPGMDGADLLSKIKELHPDSIRIILSGHSEKEAVMKSVGPTHQYLAKPCDADVLRATIEKACAMRELLGSDVLKELAARLETIPSMPSLYREITDALQDENCTLERVGEIIGKDIGMSAKILKLVNSAYFGLMRPVNNVARAVAYLGIETVSALVLSAQIFSEFEDEESVGFSLEQLWNHSMQTAACAREIAKLEGASKQEADDAFLAGMLHDVGTLVLAGNLSGEYAKVLRTIDDQGVSAKEAERSVFHATHGEVGAYVMGIWGLPDSIVEAIAFHENPADATGGVQRTLTYVHAADALSQEASCGKDESGRLDMAYIETLGLTERVEVWREACLKPAGQES